MTEQRVSIFDCENPEAPRLIGSFGIYDDGQARLRQFSNTSSDLCDPFLALFTNGFSDALVAPNSDGTYFLSDFAPSGWGARFIARQLLQEREAVPSSPIGWLAQSSSFGSGRVVTCLDNSGAPKPTKVDTRLCDFSPDLLDNFYNFVQLPGQHLDDGSLRLFRPGCDLGGVRPKALITYEGCEHIVKFGLPDDQYDVPIAEYATLRLAYLAGITVPSFELVEIGSRTALVMERFDRTETGARIHCLSAYSLLNPPAVQGDDSPYTAKYSYAGLAEAVESNDMCCSSAGPELFRRMVFNIMVGNIDDHLRNHAVLMKESGVLELSPAFDLCPQIDAPFRAQSIGVGAQGRASTVSNALTQCSRFRLTKQEAAAIVVEVKDALSAWRQVFREAGASVADLQRLTACFAVAEEPGALTVDIRFPRSAPP
jgi:serine/threonine-protein kinase HipA